MVRKRVFFPVVFLVLFCFAFNVVVVVQLSFFVDTKYLLWLSDLFHKVLSNTSGLHLEHNLLVLLLLSGCSTRTSDDS